MNATEEQMVLDEIETAAREYGYNDNEYNRGYLRGTEEVASALDIDLSKIAEAKQPWQLSKRGK